MVEYMSKEQLGTPRLREEDHKLLTGGVIRVRGLSRREMLDIAELNGAAYETAMVCKAMVQPTGMTQLDIQKWQKAAPSREIGLVVQRINELSGMGEDAERAAHKSVPDESESGV